MNKISNHLLNTIHQFSKKKGVSNYSRKYPSEYIEILKLTEFLPKNAILRQRFWHIINNVYSIPLCDHCKINTVKWNGDKNQYRLVCSVSCGNQYTPYKNARIANSYDDNGCHLSHTDDAIAKRESYTMLTYGVNHTSQSEITKEKVRNKNLHLFGATNPMKVDEYKRKQQESLLINLGVTNPMHSSKICKQISDTWKNKSDYEIQQIVNRRNATNIIKYGTMWPQELELIKEKQKQTCIINWGVDNIMHSDEGKQLQIEGVRKNYGVDNVNYYNVNPDSLQKLNDYTYMFDQYWTRLHTSIEIGIELGVSYGMVLTALKKLNIPVRYAHHTTQQYKICKFIETIYNSPILQNTRVIIRPKELDIYLVNDKIAFEYNGIFHHSELRGIDKTYHITKTMLCESLGIRLIHINEDEWKNKTNIVKSRITHILNKSERIYAKNTQIIKLTAKQKNDFLNKTHIQGTCQSSINLGLMYNNELVACMTFGKSRFNKAIEWELLRYSNKLNTSVVGGASKLFKHFIKNYNPKSIISYSDKRWNIGKLYENLGFTYSHTSTPNYFYFHKSNCINLMNRQKFQKHKLKNILEFFDPELTEWENMQLNGYNRIWDCGNDVFIWNIGNY